MCVRECEGEIEQRRKGREGEKREKRSEAPADTTKETSLSR